MTFMEDGGDGIFRRAGVLMNMISDFCGFS